MIWPFLKVTSHPLTLVCYLGVFFVYLIFEIMWLTDLYPEVLFFAPQDYLEQTDLTLA